MNVRLKYDLHFNAGVYYNSNTILNNYSLRLWMITNTELAEDQNTAFERMKYFVYNHVDNTMFIDRAEQEQCAKFLQAGLNITTMPGDPVDQLIGIMLLIRDSGKGEPGSCGNYDLFRSCVRILQPWFACTNAYK